VFGGNVGTSGINAVAAAETDGCCRLLGTDTDLDGGAALAEAVAESGGAAVFDTVRAG